MNVCIVGCGLIGHKRLGALRPEDRLVAAVDTVLEKAAALAGKRSGVFVTTDWREAVCRPEVDTVIVSTTNEWLAPITLCAARAGKHVLVEKPGARSPEELDPVLAAAREHRGRVWVGFSHRYHPAVQRAREIFESGTLGPLMFIRGRYGHGGRLGYEKEWRADPKVSGGGELIDQGVHLIDLARWFLGDFKSVTGSVHTYFWNMAVEDNAFLALRTEQDQMAWLHVSCTEWKNLFSFEIYGREGKLHIEGLGGSYGTERLSYYRMLPQMGPPETTIWEYPGPDTSWHREFEAFARAVGQPDESLIALHDARAVLKIVHKIYEGNVR
ncbi:MAG: Gfo/Idh/MocA family oxidoreductase [Candidatus Acidiferrum sp.]